MPTTVAQPKHESPKQSPNVRAVVSYRSEMRSRGVLDKLRETPLGRFYRAYCKNIAPFRFAVQWMRQTFFPIFYSYLYAPLSRMKIERRRLVKLRDYLSSHDAEAFKIIEREVVLTPWPAVFPDFKAKELTSPHASYIFQDTYVAVVKDAIIDGGTNLVALGAEVICHDLFDMERDYTSEELHGKVIIAPGKKKIMFLSDDGSPEYVAAAATFVDACAPNYAHWLTEVLPRIAIFCVEERFSKVPIVVNDGLHDNIMASLLHVVGPDREIITLPADRALTVSTLYITSVVGYVPFERRRKHFEGASHGLFSPTAFRTMRRCLYSSMPGEPIKSGSSALPEKIFLRRNSGVRKLINASEIENFLVGHGFIVVEPEKLNFSEQFQLFSKARTIVGPTGAAFANLLFAPPTANIVILIGQHDDACYWYWQNMACASGNQVIYGLSTDRCRDIHSDYEVSLATLSTIMAAIQ